MPAEQTVSERLVNLSEQIHAYNFLLERLKTYNDLCLHDWWEKVARDLSLAQLEGVLGYEEGTVWFLHTPRTVAVSFPVGNGYDLDRPNHWRTICDLHCTGTRNRLIVEHRQLTLEHTFSSYLCAFEAETATWVRLMVKADPSIKVSDLVQILKGRIRDVCLKEVP